MLDERKEFQEYRYEIIRNYFGLGRRESRFIQPENMTRLSCDSDRLYSSYDSDRFLTVLTRGLLFGVYGQDDDAVITASLTDPNRQLYARIDKIIGSMDAFGEVEEGDFANDACLKQFSNRCLKVLLEEDPGCYYYFSEWAADIYIQNQFPCLESWLDIIDENPQKPTGDRIHAYDKITDEAVFQRELRNYALCCSSPEFEKISIRKGATGCENKNGSESLSETDRDNILKMTAACLMELMRLPSCKGRENIVWNRRPWQVQNRMLSPGGRGYAILQVPIHSVDLKSWCMNPSPWQELDFSRYQFRNKGQDEPLFETNTRGNQTSVTLNKTWCKECDWHLIDITEGDQVIRDYFAAHPSCSIYLDQGSGRKLKKSRLYRRLPAFCFLSR